MSIFNLRRSAIVSVAVLSLTAGIAIAESPTTAPSVTAYPLNKCIVSGEALGGDMGEPVVVIYKGQEMKFCCSSCVAKFKKDPDKYLKEMASAAGPTTKPS